MPGNIWRRGIDDRSWSQLNRDLQEMTGSELGTALRELRRRTKVPFQPVVQLGSFPRNEWDLLVRLGVAWGFAGAQAGGVGTKAFIQLRGTNTRRLWLKRIIIETTANDAMHLTADTAPIGIAAGTVANLNLNFNPASPGSAALFGGAQAAQQGTEFAVWNTVANTPTPIDAGTDGFAGIVGGPEGTLTHLDIFQGAVNTGFNYTILLADVGDPYPP